MKPPKKIDIENSLNDVKKIKKRFKELLVQREYLVKALKAIATDSENPECTMKNIRWIVNNVVNQALKKAGE